MEAENNGQLPPSQAESNAFAQRIPRKPAPFQSSHESSYPLMSGNESISNSESQEANGRTDFPGAANGPRVSKPFKRHFMPKKSWWMFDILAAAVSILATLALLGVLYAYNGRIVQELPLGITLNGMVAVLATISRTSLMIPVASGLSQGKSPAAPDPMYAGTAYRERLFVHVRWAWMVLPVALVVFSVVFLISSMLQTRSNKVKAWKSNPLALLFSDVDRRVKEASQDGMGRPDGLANAARKSRVALREGDGFWQFKELISRS